MEPEVIEAELVLPTHLSFKRVQMYEKYPKGQSRGRHWKHLRQIIQAENYQNFPPDEPNYVNIESPPSMHPCKKICDITGYEISEQKSIVWPFHIHLLMENLLRVEDSNPRFKKAPYSDPRTNLRYANAEVFKLIRSLPNEYVQRYLAQRNAAVVLK
ncbi:hypothetical protein G4B88_009778 [Cannabis sativa]|uniref:Vps72/YL1 C-terminal domain-containing protein n=1 Tax=Cannabis sativa TaxID=3483 RepID=A0A7J6E2R8_CANSA|nr:hypothetical protein G4B88_009778 [Cannabis sativa]